MDRADQAGLAQQIEDMLTPSVNYHGYEIVTVRLQFGGRMLIQIFLERLDGQRITLDECIEMNRRISVLMEIEDIVKHDYNLEVSSPGVERPLAKIKDYERFKGERVKLHLNAPIQGMKRMTGILDGIVLDEGAETPDAANTSILIRDVEGTAPESVFVVKYGLIQKAHLQPILVWADRKSKRS